MLVLDVRSNPLPNYLLLWQLGCLHEDATKLLKLLIPYFPNILTKFTQNINKIHVNYAKKSSSKVGF